MLPKNTLRDRRLDRLLIFPDSEHPYEQNILKRYDLKPFAVEKEQQAASQ